MKPTWRKEGRKEDTSKTKRVDFEGGVWERAGGRQRERERERGREKKTFPPDAEVERRRRATDDPSMLNC
jgi:hypothetical protein